MKKLMYAGICFAASAALVTASANAQTAADTGSRPGEAAATSTQQPLPQPASDESAEMPLRQQSPVTASTQQRAELGVWLMASSGPGVEIHQVTPGSAAEAAGLLPGDILLRLNGRPVVSPLEVRQIIRRLPAGEVITLDVVRNGVPRQMTATLTAMPEPYRAAFRGDVMPMEGDLLSRTQRLEQQLAMVIEELRHLREEVAQLRGSAQTTTGIGSGVGTRPEEPVVSPTPPPTLAPVAAPTPPPVAPPAPAPAQPETAAPQSTPAEPSEDDLFGTGTTEPEATDGAKEEKPSSTSATETETETTTPPATETETETETAPAETETETEAEDDLFN